MKNDNGNDDHGLRRSINECTKHLAKGIFYTRAFMLYKLEKDYKDIIR